LIKMKRLIPSAVASLAMVLLAGGCVCPDIDCAVSVSSPRAAEIDSDVRAFLNQWVTAFESRDIDAVRSILTDDERFVWLEDGETKYPTVDAVAAALASFPPALQFDYRLENVQVSPIGPDAAWARMNTHTEIHQGDETVAQFRGVVSMFLENKYGEWRIVAAHTSNVNQRARPRD